MSNYTKSTNFATKDNLTPGDPLKVVRGTEIDTEFNNIATAVATKTDNSAAAITGGTIDGATVGATTPATGSFTTLAASGTTTLAGALVGAATQAAFNTVSTTLNLGGAATAVNLGAATGTATVNNTTLAAKAITASTTLAVTGTSTLTGAVTATAGVSGPITSSSVSITGGSITGITDLAVADGGTGASTAAGGLNNLLPSQTSNANKYLQTDGTNASWDAVSLSTADITGTLGVANGGTGVTTSTGTTNVVLSNSPTLVTPTLGVATATSLQGIIGNVTPAAGSFTTLGASSTATLNTLASSGATLTGGTVNGMTVGATTASTGAFTTLSASSTATLSGLTASTALALDASKNIVSVTNTGTGSNVLATSPTLVTPVLGVATGTSFQGIIGNVTPAAGNFTTLGASSTATLNTLSSSGATLTGGTINGMTVGATTATTGAFTSLTASTTLGVTGVSTLTGGAQVTGSISGYGGGEVRLGPTTSAAASAISTQATGAPTLDFAHRGTSNTGTFNWLNGTGAASQLMTLTSTGLGIGTSSPAYKLDVSAGSAISARFLGGDGNGITSIFSRSGERDLKTWAGNSNFSGHVAAVHYQIFTNNSVSTPSLTILDTGNVGIGTTSPAAPLEVYKSTNGQNRIFVNNPSTGTGAYTSVDLTAGTANGQILQMGSGYTTSFPYVQGATVVRGGSSGVVINASGVQPIYFGINDTERARLDSSGNFLVGATSALVSAASRGNITINGTSSSVLAFGVSAAAKAYIYCDGTNLNINNVPNGYMTFDTNGLERVKIPAAGGLQSVGSVSVGNATPTTSGAGITFPATQSASSNANTLDDYEEGTWTPNQGSGLTVVGTFSSSGQYTKIGRLVTIRAVFAGSTSIAFSANSQITTNLPFSSVLDEYSGTIINDPRNASVVFAVVNNSLYTAGSLAATTGFVCTATYFAAT